MQSFETLNSNDKSLKKNCRLGGGGVGGYLRDHGPGICQKKAYISKATKPILKNEFVLESARTGAST